MSYLDASLQFSSIRSGSSSPSFQDNDMKKYFATSNALASGCDSASGLSLQPNSAMDELLFEIYDRWCNHKYRYSSVDSDTITEQSMSETGIRRQDNAYSTCSDADNRHVRRYNETSIKNYGKYR